MNNPTDITQPPTNKIFLPVTVVTLLTFTATLIAGYITEQAVKSKLEAFFNRQADGIANTYYNKLHTHVTILEGMRGYWNASGDFTYHNVTRYLESLDLSGVDKAGVSSYFFVPAIAHKDQVKFETMVQQEPNTPDVYRTYDIHPESTELFLYPMAYGFPLQGRENVIGLDYGTISERKDAIEYARDTGNLATTRSLTFQTTGKPGFFFFLPLYKPNLPIERTPERKIAFAGVVGASFRSESAFEQIFGGIDPYPYLNFHIYQGDATTDDRLLYDSDPEYNHLKPRFQATRVVRLQDQTWTIVVESKPSFSLIDKEQKLPIVVFVSGLLATILLGVFSTYQLSKIRQAR